MTHFLGVGVGEAELTAWVMGPTHGLRRPFLLPLSGLPGSDPLAGMPSKASCTDSHPVACVLLPFLVPGVWQSGDPG